MAGPRLSRPIWGDLPTGPVWWGDLSTGILGLTYREAFLWVRQIR